ncbi:hypothetical protein GQ42DRAFT_162052 [Ramicandelaber brevisporus]|nr:hypothetical protein GQ42DRAFT_162052 [Ramicandelaber brevisporus]
MSKYCIIPNIVTVAAAPVNSDNDIHAASPFHSSSSPGEDHSTSTAFYEDLDISPETSRNGVLDASVKKFYKLLGYPIDLPEEHEPADWGYYMGNCYYTSTFLAERHEFYAAFLTLYDPCLRAAYDLFGDGLFKLVSIWSGVNSGKHPASYFTMRPTHSWYYLSVAIGMFVFCAVTVIEMVYGVKLTGVKALLGVVYPITMLVSGYPYNLTMLDNVGKAVALCFYLPSLLLHPQQQQQQQQQQQGTTVANTKEITAEKKRNIRGFGRGLLLGHMHDINQSVYVFLIPAILLLNRIFTICTPNACVPINGIFVLNAFLMTTCTSDFIVSVYPFIFNKQMSNPYLLSLYDAVRDQLPIYSPLLPKQSEGAQQRRIKALIKIEVEWKGVNGVSLFLNTLKVVTSAMLMLALFSPQHNGWSQVWQFYGVVYMFGMPVYIMYVAGFLSTSLAFTALKRHI